MRTNVLSSVSLRGDRTPKRSRFRRKRWKVEMSKCVLLIRRLRIRLFLPPCSRYMATIAILGTMDTKGEEHAFLAEQIRRRGHRALLIDSGTFDAPRFQPDVARQQVAAAAG